MLKIPIAMCKKKKHTYIFFLRQEEQTPSRGTGQVRANAPVTKNMSPYQVESWRDNAGRVCRSQTKVSEVFTSRETKTWPLQDLYANCYSCSPVLIPACRVPWQASSFLHPLLSSALAADPQALKGHSSFSFFFPSCGTWLLGSQFPNQGSNPRAHSSETPES